MARSIFHSLHFLLLSFVPLFVFNAQDDGTSLSSRLASLVQSLHTSQPGADVSSALQDIQDNAAQINQAASANSARDAMINSQNACRVFKLLYPGSYVDSSSPDYTNETDVNWYVYHLLSPCGGRGTDSIGLPAAGFQQPVLSYPATLSK